jgi:transcription initiation factor TFIIA large subunit
MKQEHSESSATNAANNVKPEIKYESPAPSQSDAKFENQGAAAYASMNGYAGGGVNPMAQQRAANNLLERFGSQANASIQAAGLVQQPRSNQQNGANNSAQYVSQPDVKSDVKPNVSLSQTDGAGDAQELWQGVVDLTREFEPERAFADGFFRSQMDASDAIANAGLMLNTAENRKALRKLQKQQDKAAKRSRVGIPQTDGADEEDEDAINSDLDDSEDEMEHEEEDDEGPLGEMILCTWDKVNRVKNKWKCTLKDGVLATGGKE